MNTVVSGIIFAVVTMILLIMFSCMKMASIQDRWEEQRRQEESDGE